MFDGCGERIYPSLDNTLDGVSELAMVQKSRGAFAGGDPHEGEFWPCNHMHKFCPRVGTGPKSAASQKERLHREAAPGPGGGVCDVVGNDDGIGRQPPVFLKLFLFVKESRL